MARSSHPCLGAVCWRLGRVAFSMAAMAFSVPGKGDVSADVKLTRVADVKLTHL